MGSFGAGLASIGGSLAEAKELQRRQKLEEIKTAIEQGYLGLQQKYANIADIREKRLSAELNQPKNVQWRFMGNTAVAAGIGPDGQPFIKSFPISQEISNKIKAQDGVISKLPEDIQPIVRSMRDSAINEGTLDKFDTTLNSIASDYAKKLGAPQFDSVRQGYTPVPMNLPGLGTVTVMVPTTSRTTRVPSGQGGESFLPQAGGGDSGPMIDASQSPSMTGGAAPGINWTPAPTKFGLPQGSMIIGPRPTTAGNKAATLKPEMMAGLRVLNASLFGGDLGKGEGWQPGLDSTVNVLNSELTRYKLILAGVGSNPDPHQWKVTKLFESKIYSKMTTAEKDYVYQLNRAVDSINSLRAITGLPRSTQTLMDRYVMQLPNPVTTPSSGDALKQLKMIQREMEAAANDAINNNGKGAEAALASGVGFTGMNISIPTPVAPAGPGLPMTPPAAKPSAGRATSPEIKKAFDDLFKK